MLAIVVPESCYPRLKREAQNWVDARFGAMLYYEDSLQPIIDQWGLPWFRAGAVIHDGRGNILLMHESRVQIKRLKDEQLKQQLLANGHLPNEWIDGDGGWNLPAGRLRPGESFEIGAMRKILSETGQTILIQDLIHIRQSNKPDNLYILPVYIARVISGSTHWCTVGTSEIGWYTPAEIRAMADTGQLRSPNFVLDSLKAYEAYSEVSNSN